MAKLYSRQVYVEKSLIRHVAENLKHLKQLKKISIVRNTFPTKEYAFIESLLPNTEGASWDLCWEYDDRIEFLGKKAGWTTKNNSKKSEKCEAFKNLYSNYLEDAKEYIKNSG